MNEFWRRMIFGTLFVVIVLGCIYLGVAAAFVLFAFVVMKGSAEICNLYPHEVKKPLNPSVQLISLLFYFFFAYFAYFSFPVKYLSLLLIFLLIPVLTALFSNRHSYMQIVGACWISMFFVALPCGLMLLFYNEAVMGTNQGKIFLILTFVLIWINDIFAYLTGTLIGKHKLFVRISPNKTIEGSVGGMVFTLLTAFLVNYLWLHLMSNILMFGMTLLIVIFGDLGDLCESMMKRQAGVKDSGNMIPSHGGVLDRFDSTFMSMPVIFIYLILTI